MSVESQYDDLGWEFYDESPDRKLSDSKTSEQILEALRDVLASLHKKPATDALIIIEDIIAADRVRDELTTKVNKIYDGVLEVLEIECTNNQLGTLDLNHLPLLDAYAKNVKAEIKAIQNKIGLVKSTTAFSTWQALREKVQRTRSKRAVEELLQSHIEKAPVESLMKKYREVLIEPPTAKKSLAERKELKTARQVASEQKALMASSPKIAYSSGYRTLDIAFTGKGEPLGFLRPGEQAVVAGMTGTGKSSFSYGLVTGFAQDLHNWGLPDAKVVWWHTEEESADKVHAAGLDEGQKFHHLAQNVIIDDIGTSRRRIVEGLYILTQEAEKRSKQTGQLITRYLPHIGLLDYIQAVTSDKAQDPVKESIITAELVLRGLQAWDFDEMAKWSGLSYQEYTGEPVPQGMEHHRMAIVTFAQLNKQDDRLMSFKKNSPKDHPLTEFTLEDSRVNPGWKDPNGNNWLWEVKEGDQRVLRQNAISGSSVILKNATIILFLHRSRPYNNPVVKRDDGSLHLEDVRARLIPDKTRTGATLKHIPMEFDIDSEGFRARYYDRAAELAISQKRFQPDESWQNPGDPILPKRSRPRPFAGVRY
jgi:hypothetical protein